MLNRRDFRNFLFALAPALLAAFALIFIHWGFIFIALPAIVLAGWSYYAFRTAYSSESDPSVKPVVFMDNHTPESLAFARKQGLRSLADHYVVYLAEDPEDGTQFDNDVLDALKAVKEKWCRRHLVTGQFPPVEKKQLV